jgi:thiol-disulfide isomerase/thioredoxin
MKQILIYIILFLQACGVKTINSQSLRDIKPWMGISIENKVDGVGINAAIPGTPAEKAGLKSGDLIKKIDSTIIQNTEQLISYVQSKGVGNEVSVEFIRDNKPMKFFLKLEAKPDELVLLKKQLIGKPVPDENLERITGRATFSKNDFLGKVTIVEFWATWCGPCRQTHETLSKFAEQNPSIQVLAVSAEEKDKIQKYMSSKNHKFTTLRDSTGTFHGFFRVTAIPMTVLIDKRGIIYTVSQGGGFYLEEVLTSALKLDKEK